MSSLFYISSMSPIMFDVMLREHLQSAGDITVFTTREDVESVVRQLGIDAYLLSSSNKNVSIRQRDELFFDAAMPGDFADTCFPNTDLPIWQVLGIDRLKFWYSPQNINYLSIIENTEWDRAYVSFDIGDAIPWAISKLAAEKDCPCIAVKTEPIRTIEVYDLRNAMSFSEYYVWNNDDVRFLNKLKVSGKITNCNYAGIEKKTRFIDGEMLKKTMGFSANQVITGILFDKRDERQCRRFLNIIKKQATKGAKVFLFPIDDRAKDLSSKIFHDFKDVFTLMPHKDMLSVCDEIVSFRWDDNYCIDLPMRPIVFDVHGINGSEIIAPDGTDIKGLTI